MQCPVYCKAKQLPKTLPTLMILVQWMIALASPKRLVDIMTNLDTDTQAEVPSTLIKFALKNGAGEVEVDTARIPEDVYREALMLGLKSIGERGMSKLMKAAYP